MNNNNLKGNRRTSTGSSQYNQLEFVIQNILKANVNTAIPVKVVAVEAGGVGKAGYVDVLPLVQSYDGFNNAIPSQTIFKLPYSRVQGGVAALIIDPVPGDIGLAVFAQQDCTNLENEPKKPLTKRCFSMADGFYIGGFLNQVPTIYLELKQDNTANLVCPVSLNIKSPDVTVDCANMTVNASVGVTLNTPQTTITGNLNSGGTGGSAAEFSGNVNVTQDVTAGGISLTGHTHGGVEPGGGNTGVPNT